MKTKAVYLTVRVDVEYDENVHTDVEELMNDISSECDYDFSFDDNSAKIIGTEICGINN